MDNMIKITNDKGRTFNVRLLKIGDQYGRNDCLTWDEDRPGVEFYDATYEGDLDFDLEGRGQFTGGQYYVETLLESAPGRGLDLLGYEPAWKIDGKAMDIVRAWLDNQTEGEL